MKGQLIRSLVAVVVGTSVVPQAVAQVATANGEAQHWLVALGANPYELDLSTRDPGVRGEVVAMAGRQVWRARGGNVAARLFGTLGSDLPRGVDVSSANCRECKFTYTRRYASLGLVATMGMAPRSGWSAYVLAGPSAHVSRTGGSQSGGAFTSAELEKAPLPESQTRWSLGVSTGVGVGMPLAGGRLFIEQWLQAPGALSRDPRARDDNVGTPLMVGFRF